MDFITAQAPPYRVTVNGTAYSLPRFLSAEFQEWVALRQKAIMDNALDQIGAADDPRKADDRARFALYHVAPPLDIASLAEETLTPEGADYVIGVCMTKGGVPESVRDAFIANVHPAQKRALAWHLASADAFVKAQKEASGDPGPRGNPSTGQPPTSGGSPEITEPTSPTGSATSPDESRAA